MNYVAITTSTDRLEAAAMPFTIAGMEPVRLPCIEIVPAPEEELDAARAVSLQADLLVISSQRTLDILWPEGPLPDLEFAVVGAVTERAVADRGGTVAVSGRAGSAQLAEILAPTASTKIIIWPHAAGADPRSLQRIARNAQAFAAPVIYRSSPIAPEPDHVDLATFASPSAVSGWQLSRTLDDQPVAVIGETTRRAVEQAGARVAVVAPTPTYQSLAEAVVNYLGVNT